MTLAIVLIAGLLVTVSVQIAAFYVLYRCLLQIETRTREDLAAGLQSLIQPPGPDLPSPLAVYSDQFATLLAGRFMQQIKTMSAGVSSGHSKADQSEAIAALAGTSPWMALLAQLLPKKFRAQLIQNPQFVQQLGLFGGNGGTSSGPDADDIQERLKMQGG